MGSCIQWMRLFWGEGLMVEVGLKKMNQIFFPVTTMQFLQRHQSFGGRSLGGCRKLLCLADYEFLSIMEASPRNYLQKLLSYENLLEAENSVSHLEEFCHRCIECFTNDIEPGIYNMTNPGSITTSQVTEWMIKRVNG